MLLSYRNLMQQATFGAGCFWGVQAAFQTLEGVVQTMAGYMGGTLKNPTYEAVCTDTTGHAEVVHITYDETIISYENLLDIFWNIHDPTQYNRQGPDRGTQYRSVIFYHTEQQRSMALSSKEQLASQKIYGKPIVTQIVKAQTFYPAEEYHQDYLKKHGASACSI